MLVVAVSLDPSSEIVTLTGALGSVLRSIFRPPVTSCGVPAGRILDVAGSTTVVIGVTSVADGGSEGVGIPYPVTVTVAPSRVAEILMDS